MNKISFWFKYFFRTQAAVVLLFVLTLSAGSFLYTHRANASSDGLTGWAWSETTGWISLNSTNCDANGDGISDGARDGCPAAGTAMSKYAVTIDSSTGIISGYAWSESIGWVSFNAADIAGCGDTSCVSSFNKQTGIISGWARVLAYIGAPAGQWDGFIHLRGTAQDGSAYGVLATGCNWDGYAWGSDVVGWVHFKGTNYGVIASGNSCQTSNDLTVSVNPSPDAPLLTEGYDTTFTGSIKNIGGGTLSQTFNNQFVLDVGNDGLPQNDVTFSPATITGLNGGTEKPVTSGKWTMARGTHRISVCADQPSPSVDEYNKTNNCSTLTSGIFTVVAQTVTASLATSNAGNNTNAPFTASLNATVSGTALGPITYSFWWNCSNTTTSFSTASGSCGTLPQAQEGQCVANNSGATCFHINSSTQSVTHVYQDGGTYTPKVIIEQGTALPSQAQSPLTVAAQSLAITSFTATPSSGLEPITSTLQTAISGTATGPATYSLWWDCSNTTADPTAAATACGTLPAPGSSGTCQINSKGATCVDTNSVTKTYTSGNYVPKVIVSKGTAAPVQAQSSVSTSRQSLNVTIAANPSSGTIPLSTTLHTAVSGTAPDTINYSVWWDCNSTATTVAGATADCGALPTPANGTCTDGTDPTGAKCNGVALTSEDFALIYAAVGTFHPKVVVERGIAPSAENRATVTTVQQTLSVALTASPSTGVRPLTSTLAPTVSGTAPGTVNYSFWWNCSDTSNSVGTTQAACGTLPAPVNGQCVIDNAIGAKCNGIDPSSFVPPSHTYTTVGTYTPKVIAERGSALPAEASATVTPVLPNVDLVILGIPTADASSLVVGYTTTFTAVVKNTGATAITNAFTTEFKVDGTTVNAPSLPSLGGGAQQSVTSAPWTMTVGAHTLSVCADQPVSQVDESNETNNCATTTFTVVAQNLGVTLDASPSTGVRPLNSNLTATVSGTALGNVNYSFWWDCNSTATTVAGAVADCGALPTPTPGSCVENAVGTKCDFMPATPFTRVHQYTTVATFIPKVVVERGGAPSAESRSSVATNLPPVDLIISGNPAPDKANLLEGDSVTFTGSIKNNGTGAINTAFNNNFKIDLNNDGTIDLILTPPTTIASLGGLSQQLVTSSAWTNIPKGTHRIILCADEPSTIDESNEINNCSPSAAGSTAGVFTVGAQTLNVGLTTATIGNSTNAPMSVGITATVTGTAPGTLNYAFWWNCSNPTTNIATAQSDSSCGTLPTPNPGQCAFGTNGVKCNGVTPTTETVTNTYQNGGTYTPKVIVERGLAPAAQSQSPLVVPDQTLVPSLSASPVSGPTPLNVNLTASVLGTAPGTANYSFWWNCANTSTSVQTTETACGALPAPINGQCVSNSNGSKCNFIDADHEIVANTYTNPGSSNVIVTPKVIIERGTAAPGMQQTSVTVTPPPTLSVNLVANPSVGTSSVASTLTATVSGTAGGTINYSFWWNCSSNSTNVAATQTGCGSLPVPTPGSCVTNKNGAKCNGVSNAIQAQTFTYAPAGTYTPKVIVERSSAAPAQSQDNVTVNAPFIPNLTANLTATPDHAAGSLTTNLTASVTGPTGGTINYSFWWNCSDPSTSVAVTEADSACGALPAPVDGSCVENANGAKCNGIIPTTYTRTHQYLTTGTFTPKVIIEWGISQPVQAQSSATVSQLSAPVLSGQGVCAPTRVDLSWTAVDGVDNYHIQRCQGTSCVALGFSNTTAYSDLNAGNNVSYDYTVTGHNHTTGVFTPASNMVSAAPSCNSRPAQNPPPPPPPPPASFDYSVSNSGDVAVTAGNSGSNTITATLAANSPTSPIDLSASGLPSNTTTNFSNITCSPTCSSTLTLFTSGDTPPGTYTITVTGTPLSKTTSFNLVVNPLPRTLSVELISIPPSGPLPTNASLNAEVFGTAQGTINYSFWWNCTSGTTNLNAAAIACRSLPNPTLGKCVVDDNVGAVCNGFSDTKLSVPHTYGTTRTFTPKVIVQRDSGVPNAQARSSITTHPACSDGIDNDGDGRIDYPRDPGCTSPNDNDERNIITSFRANPSFVNPGETSVLSWSTVGLTSCRIDQGIGSVPVSSPDDATVSRTVSPPISDQVKTITYTLTCSPSAPPERVTITLSKVPVFKEVAPQ